MRLGGVIAFNANNYRAAVADAIESSRYTHKADICDLYAETMIDIIFSEHNITKVVNENLADQDGSGHVEETFWNAVVAVSTTDNFLDAIHKAVMMGGDTDTTAAVAGTIAGAKYGLSGIPDVLVKTLVKSDVLIAEARTLYEAGYRKAQEIH